MIHDCFALLGQPRQPWLDPGQLKAAYLRLSSEVHPDRFHNASPEQQQMAATRFANLNEAHLRLREPKDRLRHLLELELERKPDDIQSASAGDMELFMQLAQLCRQVDDFLATRKNEASPILKAKAFGQALEWIGQLQTAQQKVAARQGELDNQLRELNDKWIELGGLPKPAEMLSQLEQLAREFSFLARWAAQIHERTVRLSA